MVKIILACFIVVVVFAVFLFNYHFIHEPLLRTVSPNHEFTIEIFQKRFPIPVNERYVYLSASRHGEAFVQEKLLYTGDFLDDDFRALYPRLGWRSNSVLAIGNHASYASELTIQNETSERIRYLLIETSWDKLLILNVEAKGVTKVRFHFAGWISCQGEFVESGERFAAAGALAPGHKYQAAGDFLFRVKGGTVLIENPRLPLTPTACCAPDRPAFNRE